MLELNDDKMQVKIKGQVYEMSEPSVAQHKEVIKKFNDSGAEGGEDPLDIYINFFIALGLPEEVAKGLSVKKLTELFGYAVGSKKN